jgi:hypothetical protein
MKSIIIIEHGEETCAVSPGKFCRFIGSRKFGTQPVCFLYPSDDSSTTDLYDKDGWVQRCHACVKEFGPNGNSGQTEGSL